jgi:integrase
LEHAKGEKALSVQNSLVRRRQTYNRFFTGTSFEQMGVQDITARDIERIYAHNLRRYDLRKKAVIDMRCALKSVFDYSMRHGIIEVNPYLSCDFDEYKDMIVPDSKISERGYSRDEMQRVMEYLHRKQFGSQRTTYAPFALELQILCGLRRGEVPPLRWADLHDGVIEIHREQITLKATGGRPEHDEIVGHTKTWTDRIYPITDSVMDLLKRIKTAQFYDEYKGQYLFPAKSGCISNSTVYQFYRRMCDALDIPVRPDRIRGTHAFRRNAITDVINRTGGNSVMASQLFGNSPQVAEKHYFTGVDLSAAKQFLS